MTTTRVLRAHTRAVATPMPPNTSGQRRAAGWLAVAEEAADTVNVEEDDEEDDERVTDATCVCQGRGDGLMVQCDLCDDWFHTACVGLSDELARALKSYICDSCSRPLDEPYRTRRGIAPMKGALEGEGVRWPTKRH